MTDVRDAEALSEALRMIDQRLGELKTRELVSAAEVADLLLDLRLLLLTAEPTLSQTAATPA